MPDLYYRNPTDGQEMVLIPAGPAVFGEDHRFIAELPDYYLGIHCVTNRQYARFLNAVRPGGVDIERWIFLGEGGPITETSGAFGVDAPHRWAEHPVVLVSWYGAVAYCEWARLRLPSELEWEKGAGGPDGSIYPWGDEWDAEMCQHNVAGRRGRGTCKVDAYPAGASYWGLRNMSGNVWEWCADWDDEDAYRRYASGDLTPPEAGGSKVVRGGSWFIENTGYFRCASRSPLIRPPWNSGRLGGFRCARGLMVEGV